MFGSRCGMRSWHRSQRGSKWVCVWMHWKDQSRWCRTYLFVYVYVFVYVEWLVVRKYLKGMNQFFWEWIEMSGKIWMDVVRGDPLIQGLRPHPGVGTSSRGWDLIQGLRPHPGVATSSRGCDLIQGRRRIAIESSVDGPFLNKYVCERL